MDGIRDYTNGPELMSNAQMDNIISVMKKANVEIKDYLTFAKAISKYGTSTVISEITKACTGLVPEMPLEIYAKLASGLASTLEEAIKTDGERMNTTPVALNKFRIAIENLYNHHCAQNEYTKTKADLTTRLESNLDRKTSYQRQVQKLEEELSSIEKEQQGLQQKMQELNEKLTKLYSDPTISDAEKMIAAMTSIPKEIASLEDKMSSNTGRMNGIKQKISKFNSEIEVENILFEYTQKDYTALEEDHDKTKSGFDSDKAIEVLRSDIDELSSFVEEKRDLYGNVINKDRLLSFSDDTKAKLAAYFASAKAVLATRHDKTEILRTLSDNFGISPKPITKEEEPMTATPSRESEEVVSEPVVPEKREPIVEPSRENKKAIDPNKKVINKKNSKLKIPKKLLLAAGLTCAAFINPVRIRIGIMAGIALVNEITDAIKRRMQKKEEVVEEEAKYFKKIKEGSARIRNAIRQKAASLDEKLQAEEFFDSFENGFDTNAYQQQWQEENKDVVFNGK